MELAQIIIAILLVLFGLAAAYAVVGLIIFGVVLKYIKEHR